MTDDPCDEWPVLEFFGQWTPVLYTGPIIMGINFGPTGFVAYHDMRDTDVLLTAERPDDWVREYLCRPKPFDLRDLDRLERVDRSYDYQRHNTRPRRPR